MVALATGAGSTPSLTLAGTASIQNIYAATGTTLTLPALAVSASTVNIGSLAGSYNGNVVFGGAAALTGSSGSTLNVNAGSLLVGSTLTGGSGASVLVNSGATLIGGPAAVIAVPLTVNSGGVLVPDAGQVSTALIGSSLTMASSSVFQWVYNGPSLWARLPWAAVS